MVKHEVFPPLKVMAILYGSCKKQHVLLASTIYALFTHRNLNWEVAMNSFIQHFFSGPLGVGIAIRKTGIIKQYGQWCICGGISKIQANLPCTWAPNREAEFNEVSQQRPSPRALHDSLCPWIMAQWYHQPLCFFFVSAQRRRKWDVLAKLT